MNGLDYEEFAPPPDLATWVEAFWLFDTHGLGDAPRDHVIVPDGAVSLTHVRLADGTVFAGLTGPSVLAHRTQVFPGLIYGGIRLRPGVAGSVLRADVTRFRGGFGPVMGETPDAVNLFGACLQGRSTRPELLDGMVEAARQVVAEAAAPDPAVCALADAIIQAGGDVQLDALYAEADLGPRQLRRRFVVQCGLTPKEFARLRRVRETCIRLLAEAGSGAGMAGSAAASGFADESHMGREFRSVFGNSARLVTDYLAQIRHGALVGAG